MRTTKQAGSRTQSIGDRNSELSDLLLASLPYHHRSLADLWTQTPAAVYPLSILTLWSHYRGEGRPSPLPWGVGAGAPAACGPLGGLGGGGCAAASLVPLWGGGPRFPTLAPLLSSAHSPPACSFGRGRRAAPGGGGNEERPVDRSPGGPFRPGLPLCPPRVGNGHGGGSWGAQPPYCSGAPP